MLAIPVCKAISRRSFVFSLMNTDDEHVPIAGIFENRNGLFAEIHIQIIHLLQLDYAFFIEF